MNWWSMLTVIVFFRTAGVWSGCVHQPPCANCTVTILSCDNEPFGPNLSSDEFPVESYYAIYSLKLNNSRIQNLDTGVFDDMSQLQILSLSFNSIHKINCCVFSTLTILRELILSNNNITTIDESSFDKQLKLQTLDLSYNQLTSLGNGKLFKNLKALRVLNVSHNKLSVLFEKIFLSQRNLSTLHLNFNQLSRVQVGVLYPLDSLTTLSLQGNPLNCDCDLRETILWCDAHKLKLDTTCRDHTGQRTSLQRARNLTECDKSSVPSVTSSPEFIILAVLLIILIVCVCVYFGARAWRKISNSTNGTKRSNTKPENNTLNSEDNVYEYMPPPSYSYTYSLDYPALPPRPTLIADSGEDNGHDEGPSNSNNSSGNHETKTHSSKDKVTFVEHDEMIDYRKNNAIHMSSDYATPMYDESNNASNQHYSSSKDHSGKQVSTRGLMKSNSMYCE